MTRNEHDCPPFEELIEPYVDGALSDEERARLEAHLDTCPACAEQVQQAQRLARMLPTALAHEPDTVEHHSLAATRRAQNAMAGDRAPSPARIRKNRRTRALFLIAGWLGSLAIFIKGLFWGASSAGGAAPLREAVETASSAQWVQSASQLLAIDPAFVTAGAVMLVLCTAWSIRMGLDSA